MSKRYNRLECIKKIRKEMQTGLCLSDAVFAVGIKSMQTLFYWRKKNPRIDKYIVACMEMGEDKRTDAVENAFTRQLLKGEGSASAYAFYLCNRRPERWKALATVVNNNNNNNFVSNKLENNLIKAIEGMTVDELKRIIDIAERNDEARRETSQADPGSS